MTLYEKYKKEIVPALSKELGITNELAVPRLSKIVVNIGLGEAIKDKKVLDIMSEQLSLIIGQKPIVTRAKQAISTFKLRHGMPIGLKVTIRRKRMYDFFEKLVTIALPRTRDFRGISKKAFDKKGNISIGITEVLVFPEADFEKLDKVRGLQVTIATTAKTDKEGIALLTKLGMPFQKEQ